jgi:hypothetical protein
MITTKALDELTHTVIKAMRGIDSYGFYDIHGREADMRDIIKAALEEHCLVEEDER